MNSAWKEIRTKPVFAIMLACDTNGQLVLIRMGLKRVDYSNKDVLNWIGPVWSVQINNLKIN